MITKDIECSLTVKDITVQMEDLFHINDLGGGFVTATVGIHPFKHVGYVDPQIRVRFKLSGALTEQLRNELNDGILDAVKEHGKEGQR